MLSEITEQKIIAELDAGSSLRKVAKMHGVSMSTVQRVKAKHEADSDDDDNTTGQDDVDSDVSEDSDDNVSLPRKRKCEEELDSSSDEISNIDEEDLEANFGLDDVEIDTDDLARRVDDYRSQIDTIAAYGSDVRKAILEDCSPRLIEVLRDICVYVVLKLERTEREDRKMEKHRKSLEDLFAMVVEDKSSTSIRNEMIQYGDYLSTILNMYLDSIDANEADDDSAIPTTVL